MGNLCSSIRPSPSESAGVELHARPARAEPQQPSSVGVPTDSPRQFASLLHPPSPSEPPVAGPSGAHLPAGTQLTSQQPLIQGPAAMRRPVVNTTYPHEGIQVVQKEGESPTFPGQVNSALNTIASKPNGNEVLNSLANSKNVNNWPFATKIVPATSKMVDTPGGASRREYTAGSVTQSFSDTDASSGKGAQSAIRWNPQSTLTPDGERPPFVGLGHELVHSMHNANGTTIPSAGDTGKQDDEHQATGIGNYADSRLTENGIREEHGLPRRDTYSGLEEG